VSKDVCPNLPVGGVTVLGVEPPPYLPRPTSHELSAPIMYRQSSDDTKSETAANRFLNTMNVECFFVCICRHDDLG
jgi:hypothetical protein